MHTPLISIIIPVYNVESFLRICLDSVRKQTFKDFEAIIVNDGSSDASKSICEQYIKIDSRFLLIDKPNGGLSDARNAGTKVAKGKYIFYLDSDDWLSNDALEVLYSAAENNNCQIVQGNYYYSFVTHSDIAYTIQSDFLKVDKLTAMRELLKDAKIKNFAWGKLYLRELATKYQFPKGKFFEDCYWQYLIINECNNYGIVSTPLYFYRQRSSSISGNFSIRNYNLLQGHLIRLHFIENHYKSLHSTALTNLFCLTINFYSSALNLNKQETLRYREFFENLCADYGSELKKLIRCHYCCSRFFANNFSGVLLKYYLKINRFIKR